MEIFTITKKKTSFDNGVMDVETSTHQKAFTTKEDAIKELTKIVKEEKEWLSGIYLDTEISLYYPEGEDFQIISVLGDSYEFSIDSLELIGIK